MSRGFRIELGGTAVVCCVHDVPKRQITDPDKMTALAREQGIALRPGFYKTHLCSCCGNLFVDPSDEPRYCSQCLRRPRHALGGPLPEPKGVVT